MPHDVVPTDDGEWSRPRLCHRGSGVRRFGAAVAIVLIGILILRTFVIQGLMIPVRVVSGSMGDALPGPHWHVVCHRCRFEFGCGTDCPADQATCPNCGYAANPLTGATLRPGRRVLIDRLSLHLRRPRRWEVVVARLPTTPSRLAVKRVVGLPGEVIRFRDGDIYADGSLVRKDLRQQRSMSLLVHDDRFQPRPASEFPPRWRPASNRLWRRDGAHYCFVPQENHVHRGDDQGASAAGSASRKASRLDWLVYHNWACLPDAVRPFDEAPVSDNYGYNQGISRDLAQVADLVLTFRITVSGDGVLAVMAHDGRETFQCRWDTGRGRLRLIRGHATVAHADLPSSLTNRELRSEFMLCDHQVQLAFDGKTYLAYSYPTGNSPPRPIAQPLAIGARDATVRITDIQVWRDIYYTGPLGWLEDQGLEIALADDEYLLLGDNCPISRDGRHSVADGRLSPDHLVGRVLPIPSVSSGFR